MTKYREILRLLSLGISERKIAESCGVSRNTVSRIRKRADEIGLKWPLDASQTDKVLETRLYPKRNCGYKLKTDAGLRVYPKGIIKKRRHQKASVD